METTVLLVDDHPLLRQGLRLLVERDPGMRVVGEAGDGQQAINLARELSPDVVVMDITMPDVNGIEATRSILAESPHTKVVALSIHAEKRFVEDMLLAGAAGYILKESAPEDVVNGIRAVMRGEVYLSAAITEIVVSGFRERLSGDPSAAEPTGPADAGPTVLTKLHRPRTSSRLVSRSRLLELLERGRGRPLTLVSAPAGYGKSTLVSQWLETIESDCPGAWLSLDERDNDLRLFMAHLVAAVQTQFPEALQGTSLLLKAPALPAMQVLVGTLVNELLLVPQRFILVLDDYHRIVERSIHGFLSELLRHPPQTVHLVLVTRSDPSLDLLQLRASRQMGEMRSGALSFTTEETAAFLFSIVGKAVDEEIAKALTEKTEGWAAGLHLITLSARDSAGLADVSGTLTGEQYTLDYLAAEALSHQPRDVQAWLLQTSILDRFCASLCEAVCAPPDKGETSGLSGNGFIQWLTEKNIFVISLDPRNQWFRYHHLFRELLKNQLQKALDATEIAALHARASRWFAENDLIEQAIGHALAAGDVVGAAEIVERHRLAKLETEHWYVLDKWLSMLPDAVKQQRVELLLAQAEVFLVQQNLIALLSTLERVEQALGSDDSNAPLWGEVNYFRGYLAYFQGQGSRANEFQKRALDLIPESNRPYRSEAELHYALSLHMTGDREKAIHLLERWLRSKSHGTAHHWAGLGYIHTLEGNLVQALYAAQQTRAVASKKGDVYADGWFRYMQACAHFYQNELEKAFQEFSWLVENQYHMQRRVTIDSLCGLALLGQMARRPEKAAQATRQLHEYALETDDPVNVALVSSCQARLSLLQGDITAARRWLQTVDTSTDEGIMLWWIELPRFTECRVLIAEGADAGLQQAVTKLELYEGENQAVHNRFQTIVMLPLLALAFKKQGRVDKALSVLERAVNLAEPGGWVQPFVELGPPIAGLLQQLRMRGVAGDYVSRILSAFPEGALETALELPTAAAGDGAPTPTLVEPLTSRELEILRLLATSLSAKEIAAELVVSVATVHTHSKNIYGKLDVHSRIQAVERAQESGLI